MDKHPFQLTERHKRLLAGISFLIFILLFLAVAWFVGRPMVRFVQKPELFREWVDAHGIWGNLAFLGMMFLQVVVAVIPGEPLEIGAGYAFGAVEGTLLCLLATTLSSMVIFLIVKRYGMKFVTLFVSEEKLHSLKFLQDTRRLELLTFLLFFIPGTPKDVLTYVVGLTPMKLRVWVLITAVARIPSVVTSTAGGSALGSQDYRLAVIVFVATAAVSGLGVLLYRAIQKRHSRQSAPPPEDPSA